MLTPLPAGAPLPTVAAPRPTAQIGRITRWVAIAVIFFLADAIQLLLLLPDRTGELFAWAIDPQITSLVLGAAYVAGAYFFVRVVMASAWDRVAAGFPAVIVFVWLAAASTALHLDRFIHDGLSFAAWAAIYSIAPVGLPLLYLAQRRRTRSTLAGAPMSGSRPAPAGAAPAPRSCSSRCSPSPYRRRRSRSGPGSSPRSPRASSRP